MSETPGKIRVLFVTTAFPTVPNDPRGHHVFSLAQQVARAGAIVTVVAPAAPGSALVEMVGDLEVHRFRYSPLGRERLATGVSGILPNLRARPTLLLQIPPLMIQMARKARALSAEADIVHGHWIYPAGLLSLRAARRSGVPVVVTAHGGDVSRGMKIPGLRRLIKYVGNAVDRILTVSESLADQLVNLGVDSSQIEVLPLGVDEPRFGRKPQPPSARPKLLFAGSLIPLKDVATLLEAVALIPSDLVDLEIIGDGPERWRLEDRAKSLKSRVVFRGSVPPHEVQRAMAASDFLVLPSRSEGRPVVVMEAMAAGLPVIGSDIPGTRELVRDGYTGLLFDVGNPHALAAGIERLATDSELRSHYAKAGRARFDELGLGGSAAGERYASVYRAVLGEAAADRLKRGANQ